MRRSIEDQGRILLHDLVAILRRRHNVGWLRVATRNDAATPAETARSALKTRHVLGWCRLGEAVVLARIRLHVVVGLEEAHAEIVTSGVLRILLLL